MDRGLDGCYFRVKRGDGWANVCFSDLTKEERETVTEGKTEEWLKSLCFHLADCIAWIGDELERQGICVRSDAE